MRPKTLAEAVALIRAGAPQDTTLAKQRRLGRVPARVCNPARRLAEPWFTASSSSDAMREYLTFASPAEFASRNIFTEERPLRRARGPQTAKA